MRPTWAVAYASRTPNLRQMRRLDLLAAYFLAHPAERHGNTPTDPVGQASTGTIVAAILGSAR
jgi:hypothetical protein